MLKGFRPTGLYIVGPKCNDFIKLVAKELQRRHFTGSVNLFHVVGVIGRQMASEPVHMIKIL